MSTPARPGGCNPVLVGEVEYRLVTRDARLRHASWRGLRPDREPASVRMPVVPA